MYRQSGSDFAREFTSLLALFLCLFIRCSAFDVGRSAFSFLQALCSLPFALSSSRFPLHLSRRLVAS